MGVFNPLKNKELENLKPYYIVNGSLTKEGHPFVPFGKSIICRILMVLKMA